MVNKPNSQNDVLTTMAHALMSFEELVRTEMPGIPVVYVENLSYEEALKQLDANNGMMGNPNPNKTLPLFAYKRTILKEIEDKGLGKRAKTKNACINIDGEILNYKVAYGEFEIQFLYASNNIELTEKFEVVYNSDTGITGTKEMSVDMGEGLGTFKYYLQYEELAEKLIEHEDFYYKGVIGTISVRGFYFTFTGKSGLINKIRQRIIATTDIPGRVENEILSDITCP